jgi:DinB superfamily
VTARQPVEELVETLRLVTDALASVADRDWSVPAAGLDWSCWHTVDHMLDCVLSYTLQIAGQAKDGWLALQELHAKPGATPRELVEALGATGETMVAVLGSAPDGFTASDGIQQLDAADWVARAMHELLVHTSDTLTGLGATFDPPAELCRDVLASPALWAIDRERAAAEDSPWHALLAGSGRPAR